MFTRAERSALRARLVELAEADPQVVGAALVGSAARDAEDDLSDIDLVLQLAEDADEPSVVAGWTAEIERIAGAAVDTLDVRADGVRYRVFLLPSSLQVDVSFWPRDRFRAAGGPFRLLFGTPAEPTEPGRVDVDQVIGLGWLYALHARSAIARGRLWQAAGMLDELRGSLLTFTYAGSVPEQCLAIETVGEPTTQELEQAYATDARTREWGVEEWSTQPTLEADWWPEGQEARTTHLCGRWWVSDDDGTFLAFAAAQHVRSGV